MLSPSPSFPITAEFAHMVLGYPFKVSRCRTIQALKLSARVKRIRYNTAAVLDEALIHDAANFTVDDMAASLAARLEAQRQQLLDLFGYVEPPDPAALADPTVQKCSPAIDSPSGCLPASTRASGGSFTLTRVCVSMTMRRW